MQEENNNDSFQKSKNIICLLISVKSATASFNYFKIVKSGAKGLSFHLTSQQTNYLRATVASKHSE